MCILYERLSKLCEEKGVSGAKMAADCEMSKSAMTELRKGRRDGFSAKNMNKLANYFGVTVGYLLGEEEKENAQPELDEVTRELISIIKKLTDSEKLLMIDMAKSIIARR